jgi:hypothetical protein
MTPHSSRTVIFRYGIFLASSFDELSEPADSVEVELSDVLARAFALGRILIQARGGAGKSTTLERLAEVARREEIRVMKLDLLSLVATLSTDRVLTADVLAAITSEDIPALSETDRRSVLFVDGINEIAPDLANGLLKILDSLANSYPSWAVIATDRLHRRDVATANWQLASLTPVQLSNVQELLAGRQVESDEMATLQNPYYLRLALSDATGSKSAQQRDFLVRHGGVAQGDLVALAAFAFGEYSAFGDRRIDVNSLETALSSAKVERMKEAGTLITHPTPRFFHHLVSDYLASAYLASHPEQWTYKGFNALTFHNASFDALAMLLEQLQSGADDLLRAVYDWNHYGAAYLLADDDVESPRISTELSVAILGMLAEKRFDLVTATRVQVTDAIRSIGTSTAMELARATSRPAVVEIIRRNQPVDASPWFREWIKMYELEDEAIAGPSVLNRLNSDDPVLGWTAGNVLRRCQLNPASLSDIVRDLENSKSPVVRWRSAHALGSHGNRKTARALLKALSDDDSSHVQYGALRSLIEIAAVATPHLRQQVMGGLVQCAELIAAESGLRKATIRDLPLEPSPEGWPDATSSLVSKMWALSTTVSDQDEWRIVGARIRALDSRDDGVGTLQHAR